MKWGYRVTICDLTGGSKQSTSLDRAASATGAIRLTVGLLLGLALFAATLGSRTALAEALPACSWPLETTGSGISNVAYPDTNATYWTMPFDSSRWKELIITGAYPEARFMSFITYDALASAADSIVDYAIKPDLHSENPFKPGKAGDGDGQGHTFGNTYTISISRSGKAAKGG